MRNKFLRIFKSIILATFISALMLLAVSAENVVFIKDGGTGDGSSPDNAAGTLTSAHNALDLTADDATVVVCGPYTQTADWKYSKEFEGSVTFTSVYGGVDYRESADAAYTVGNRRFLCYGNVTFENMAFECTGDYFLVIAQHKSVTVGEGVTVTGEKLLGKNVATSFTILGGYQEGAGLAKAEDSTPTNITVLSGSKIYVIPYSRGFADGKYTGAANITVGGDAKLGVLHGSVASGGGCTVGDVKITIKDNAEIEDFYGCTEDVTVKSYTFNISGGKINRFNWVCPATSAKELTVTGKKTLKLGGDFDYHAIMDNFDKISGGDVVFVKDGGSGDGSNLANAASNLQSALGILDRSKDCTVVICGPYTQGNKNITLTTKYTGKITFTSVYGGVDYRESGANWQFDGGNYICYGATTFENLNFISLGGNYTVVAQHNPVVLGEGINIEGDNLTATTLATSFCIVGSYRDGLGAKKALDASDISVTVLSGSKIYVVPFSINITGQYMGTANITIGGTANLGVLHGTCVGSNNNKLGNLRVTVKDSAIINNFYGATSTGNTINSVHFYFESGRIYSFKWASASSITITFTTPTVLYASRAAASSQYFANPTGNFHAVVYGTDSDLAVAKPEKAKTDMLKKIAGGKAYNTFSLDGESGEVSLKLPSNATKGMLYYFDGDYLTKLSADAVGNKHLGFDFERNGTYVLSTEEFFTPGDIDANGEVNVVDTMYMLNILLGDSDMPRAAADIDNNHEISLLDVIKQLRAVVSEDDGEEDDFTFNPDDYNVLSEAEYEDKTKLGFLSQLVGFLSGYEFARDPSTNKPMIAMADSYFEMCNGAYADYKSINPHQDKHLLNEETGIWEVWNDDDFSIDILDQYIIRDSFEKYGTFNTKVITDSWIGYNVYDMGGGNRDIGAYGLMKNYRYLSVFSGNTEMSNNFNVNGEPYIGNETVGMNAPGMPNLAVELAHKFGMTTSDRDPVEWLRMFAAMYSLAYFEDDIPTIIRTAQNATMVEGSYPYEVVDECFKLYAKYPKDWRRAITEADTLFRTVAYDNSSYMGCTSINCSFIILGLLYGDGDYYNTCKIISLAGHGGDSTTPTALGVVGIVTGWDGLDKTSKNVINEKVWQNGEGIIVNLPILDEENPESYGTWMYMANAEERFKIADLLDMYKANFESLLYENGGFKQGGNYYIPKQTVSSLDTVYAEHFEDGGISSYTVKGGTSANPADPFMGKNSLELGAGSGEATAYTTVSGLTVGKTYKLSAFIRTSDGVTANMFVREKGAAIENYVTVHDSNVYVRRFTVGVGENDMCSYVKRELVFTATKSSMEIGFMLPSGTVSGGSVAVDNVNVIRFEENKVANVSVVGTADKNGAYTGHVRFELDGGSEKEVWLKLTYSSTAKALSKAFTLVNREWQSRTPIVPTNGGNVTVYIPVLADNAGENLVSMYFDGYGVTVHEAALVIPQSRF